MMREEAGRGLSYSLMRTKRRTISVEVHADGGVVVRCPMRLPIHAIEHFLRSRGPWIAAKLFEARDARRVVPPLPSPNHYYHRGEAVSGDRRRETGERGVRKLYGEVIDELLPALGLGAVRYQGFTIRRMQKRWGSCRIDGKITLNRYLIWTPDVCIRAVIAHELAHVIYMDHGPQFQSLVRDIMPNYDEADELLDAWTAVIPRPEKRNGAHGPVEQRIVWLDQLGTAQISSNALVSADAMSSAMRPSI